MADEKIDVVRAWKDEEYRNTLTPEQVQELPPNPVGESVLNEDDLETITGGTLPSGRKTHTSGKCIISSLSCENKSL